MEVASAKRMNICKLNFSPAFSIYPRIIVIGHFLNSEID
jgi:hypothetical protein